MSFPPLDPRDQPTPPEADSAAGGRADPAQALQHLEQVLASATFSGARNQQRLLRFLVERLVQGDAAHLKEYTLGVEVFGRGADFDPRLDPIVRVEASRLRSRLHKYYETEGQSSALCIDLPRGGYVPTVTAHAPACSEPASPSQPSQPEAAETIPAVAGAAPRRKRRFWAWIAAVSVICSALMVWLAVRSGETATYNLFTRLTRDQDRCTSPSLSPDGKRVVYAGRQNAQWDIWLRDIGGVKSRNLTSGSHSDNFQPAFAPDGRHVAFRSSRDGGGVFVLDTASGSVRRLANFGYHPAWSPDGKRLAISSETFQEPAEFAAARRSRIFILDAQSGASRAVTAPNLDAVQPTWSPNGRRIAYWGANSGGEINVWTVAVDGAAADLRPVAVTSDHWTDWSPAWSPDGKYLYFSSDRAGTMNLWRVRIDQSGGETLGAPEPLTTPSSNSGWISFARDGHRLAYARRLTYSKLYRQGFDPVQVALTGTAKELTSGERRIREPAISPDGAWVAARVQDPQSDLVLMRPDGSQMTRLTNDAFFDRLPRWSPDGRSIVFQSNRGGEFGLWLIQPNGQGLRQLPASAALHTAWAPDGSLVAYPHGGKPYVLEPAGKAISAAALAAPDLLPLAWSRDRRHITGWLASGEPGREPLEVYSVSDRSYWHVAGHGNDPVWLKNGHGFLFGGWNTLQYADVRDNTTRLLLTLSGAELHPKFALSQDERFLLYVAMEDEEDIWIAER